MEGHGDPADAALTVPRRTEPCARPHPWALVNRAVLLPMNRAAFVMRESLLTFPPLGPARTPGLFDLRLLERRLQARLAELDARVDHLLALPGAPTDAQVAAVDVLCAAIAESQELLDEARRDAAHEARRRRERRQAPRRWS